MPFTAIKVSHKWCLQFIDNVLPALCVNNALFQTNNGNKFDCDKFEEIYWECCGYRNEGIDYIMWADPHELSSWCFDDISSSDADLISRHWIKFITNKIKRINKEINAKRN